MHLRVRDPVGRISCLALSQIPIYRFALRRVPFPGQTQEEADGLGLTLDYTTGGTVSWMILVAVKAHRSAEAERIAKVGLPGANRVQNRERVAEAFKVLHNLDDIKAGDVEDLVADAMKLVDVYHDLQEALWGVKPPPSALETMAGPVCSYDVAGWVGGITREPYEPWVVQKTSLPDGLTGVGPQDPEKPAEKPEEPARAPRPSREQRRKARQSTTEPEVLDVTGDTRPLGAHRET